MCEFCPIIGRCSVCEHVTSVDYSGIKPAPPMSRYETLLRLYSTETGFPITYNGVTVRFANHRDAVACLTAIPQARVK